MAKLLARLPVCDTGEGVSIGRIGSGGLGSWLQTAPAPWTGIAVGSRRAKLLARLPVCDTGEGVFIGRVGSGGLGSWLRTVPCTAVDRYCGGDTACSCVAKLLARLPVCDTECSRMESCKGYTVCVKRVQHCQQAPAAVPQLPLQAYSAPSSAACPLYEISFL